MRTHFFQAGIGMLLLPLGAAAQMHHVDAPERVTRAVGVYEWVGDFVKPAAARLVPVTLFINGKTEDAGTYLARPVPMALETGNLYAVEFAGLPKGTLHVMLAKDVATDKAADDGNAAGNWYGYGLFELPKPAKASTLKPSVVLPALTSTGEDDRPHFVAPRAQAADDSAGERRAAAGVSDDDPEKPTLGKRDPDANPERPVKKKKDKPAGYVTGLPNGLNDDPDRPTLGRNKTGQVQTPPLTGLPKEMKQAVAVSDAVSPENHEFAREWENADERAQALAGAEKIATAAVKDYFTANGLVPAKEGEPVLTPVVKTPVVAPKSALHSHHTPVKIVQTAMVLSNESLTGLQLSYGGLPTVVYSAETTAGQVKSGAGALQVKVFATVVAQRLPSGELQVSLKSVTDDAHFSRVPWMRFVDAVDADGSHRASLLFELRGKQSRQFALYRLVSAQAEQTFATALLE